ncbi:hypothetical protein ACFLTD_00355, partial [Elusimicrobiota bacterium]
DIAIFLSQPVTPDKLEQSIGRIVRIDTERNVPGGVKEVYRLMSALDEEIERKYLVPRLYKNEQAEGGIVIGLDETDAELSELIARSEQLKEVEDTKYDEKIDWETIEISRFDFNVNEIGDPVVERKRIDTLRKQFLRDVVGTYEHKGIRDTYDKEAPVFKVNVDPETLRRGVVIGATHKFRGYMLGYLYARVKPDDDEIVEVLEVGIHQNVVQETVDRIRMREEMIAVLGEVVLVMGKSKLEYTKDGNFIEEVLSKEYARREEVKKQKKTSVTVKKLRENIGDLTRQVNESKYEITRDRIDQILEILDAGSMFDASFTGYLMDTIDLLLFHADTDSWRFIEPLISPLREYSLDLWSSSADEEELKVFNRSLQRVWARIFVLGINRGVDINIPEDIIRTLMRSEVFPVMMARGLDLRSITKILDEPDTATEIMLNNYIRRTGWADFIGLIRDMNSLVEEGAYLPDWAKELYDVTRTATEFYNKEKVALEKAEESVKSVQEHLRRMTARLEAAQGDKDKKEAMLKLEVAKDALARAEVNLSVAEMNAEDALRRNRFAKTLYQKSYARLMMTYFLHNTSIPDTDNRLREQLIDIASFTGEPVRARAGITDRIAAVVELPEDYALSGDVKELFAFEFVMTPHEAMHQLSELVNRKGLFAQLNYDLVPFMVDQAAFFEAVPQAGTGFWEDIALLGASINDGDIFIIASKLNDVDINGVVDEIRSIVAELETENIEKSIPADRLLGIEMRLHDPGRLKELLEKYKEDKGVTKDKDDPRKPRITSGESAADEKDKDKDKKDEEKEKLTRIGAFLTGLLITVNNESNPFIAYRKIFTHFGKDTQFTKLKKSSNYDNFIKRLNRLYRQFLTGSPESALRTYELGAMLKAFIYYYASGDPDKMAFLQTVLTRLPAQGGLDPNTAVEIVRRHGSEKIRQLNMKLSFGQEITWEDYLLDERIPYEMRNKNIADIEDSKLPEGILQKLHDNNIVTIGNLLRKTKKEILSIRGISRKTLNLLEDMLRSEMAGLEIGIEALEGVRLELTSIDLHAKRKKLRGEIRLEELLSKSRSAIVDIPEGLVHLHGKLVEIYKKGLSKRGLPSDIRNTLWSRLNKDIDYIDGSDEMVSLTADEYEYRTVRPRDLSWDVGSRRVKLAELDAYRSAEAISEDGAIDAFEETLETVVNTHWLSKVLSKEGKEWFRETVLSMSPLAFKDYHYSEQKNKTMKNVELLAITGDFVISEDARDIEVVVGIKHTPKQKRSKDFRIMREITSRTAVSSSDRMIIEFIKDALPENAANKEIKLNVIDYDWFKEAGADSQRSRLWFKLIAGGVVLFGLKLNDLKNFTLDTVPKTDFLKYADELIKNSQGDDMPEGLLRSRLYLANLILRYSMDMTSRELLNDPMLSDITQADTGDLMGFTLAHRDMAYEYRLNVALARILVRASWEPSPFRPGLGGYYTGGTELLQNMGLTNIEGMESIDHNTAGRLMRELNKDEHRIDSASERNYLNYLASLVNTGLHADRWSRGIDDTVAAQPVRRNIFRRIFDRIKGWIKKLLDRIMQPADDIVDQLSVPELMEKNIISIPDELGNNFRFEVFIRDVDEFVARAGRYNLVTIIPAEDANARRYNIVFQAALFQMSPAILKRFVLPSVLHQLQLISNPDLRANWAPGMPVSLADFKKTSEKLKRRTSTYRTLERIRKSLRAYSMGVRVNTMSYDVTGMADAMEDETEEEPDIEHTDEEIAQVEITADDLEEEPDVPVIEEEADTIDTIIGRDVAEVVPTEPVDARMLNSEQENERLAQALAKHILRNGLPPTVIIEGSETDEVVRYRARVLAANGIKVHVVRSPVPVISHYMRENEGRYSFAMIGAAIIGPEGNALPIKIMDKIVHDAISLGALARMDYDLAKRYKLITHQRIGNTGYMSSLFNDIPLLKREIKPKIIADLRNITEPAHMEPMIEMLETMEVVEGFVMQGSDDAEVSGKIKEVNSVSDDQVPVIGWSPDASMQKMRIYDIDGEIMSEDDMTLIVAHYLNSRDYIDSLPGDTSDVKFDISKTVLNTMLIGDLAKTERFRELGVDIDTLPVWEESGNYGLRVSWRYWYDSFAKALLASEIASKHGSLKNYFNTVEEEIERASGRTLYQRDIKKVFAHTGHETKINEALKLENLKMGSLNDMLVRSGVIQDQVEGPLEFTTNFGRGVRVKLSDGSRIVFSPTEDGYLIRVESYDGNAGGVIADTVSRWFDDNAKRDRYKTYMNILIAMGITLAVFTLWTAFATAMYNPIGHLMNYFFGIELDLIPFTWNVVDHIVNIAGRFMRMFGLILPSGFYEIARIIISCVIPSAIFNLVMTVLNRFAVHRALVHQETTKNYPLFKHLERYSDLEGKRKPTSQEAWSLMMWRPEKGSVRFGRYDVFKRAFRKIPEYLQVFSMSYLRVHPKVGRIPRSFTGVLWYGLSFFSGIILRMIMSVFSPLKFAGMLLLEALLLVRTKEAQMVITEAMMGDLAEHPDYEDIRNKFRMEVVDVNSVDDGDGITDSKGRKIRIYGNTLEKGGFATSYDTSRYPGVSPERMKEAAVLGFNIAKKYLDGQKIIVFLQEGDGPNGLALDNTGTRNLAEIYIKDTSDPEGRRWVRWYHKLFNQELGGWEANGDNPIVVEKARRNPDKMVILWDDRYKRYRKNLPEMPTYINIGEPSKEPVSADAGVPEDVPLEYITAREALFADQIPAPLEPVGAFPMDYIVERTKEVLGDIEPAGWKDKTLEKIIDELEGWDELAREYEKFGIDPSEVLKIWQHTFTEDTIGWKLAGKYATLKPPNLNAVQSEAFKEYRDIYSMPLEQQRTIINSIMQKFIAKFGDIEKVNRSKTQVEKAKAKDKALIIKAKDWPKKERRQWFWFNYCWNGDNRKHVLKRLVKLMWITAQIYRSAGAGKTLIISPHSLIADNPGKIRFLLMDKDDAPPRQLDRHELEGLNLKPHEINMVQVTRVGRDWLANSIRAESWDLLSEYLFGLVLFGEIMTRHSLRMSIQTSEKWEYLRLWQPIYLNAASRLINSAKNAVMDPDQTERDFRQMRLGKYALANEILASAFTSATGYETRLIEEAPLAWAEKLIIENLNKSKRELAVSRSRVALGNAFESFKMSGERILGAIHNGKVVPEEDFDTLRSRMVENQAALFSELSDKIAAALGKDPDQVKLGHNFKYRTTGEYGKEVIVKISQGVDDRGRELWEAPGDYSGDLFKWGTLIRAGPVTVASASHEAFELILHPAILQLDSRILKYIMQFYMQQISDLAVNRRQLDELYSYSVKKLGNTRKLDRKKVLTDNKVIARELNVLKRSVASYAISDEERWFEIGNDGTITAESDEDYHRIAQGVSDFSALSDYYIMVTYNSPETKKLAEQISRVLIANGRKTVLVDGHLNRSMSRQEFTDKRFTLLLRLHVNEDSIKVSNGEGELFSSEMSNKLALFISSVQQTKYYHEVLREDDLFARVPERVLIEREEERPAPVELPGEDHTLRWSKWFAVINIVTTSISLGLIILTVLMPFIAPDMHAWMLSHGLEGIARYTTHFFLRPVPVWINFVKTYFAVALVNAIRDFIMRFIPIFIDAFIRRKDRGLKPQLKVFGVSEKKPGLMNYFALVEKTDTGETLINRDVFSRIPRWRQNSRYQVEYAFATQLKRFEIFFKSGIGFYLTIRRFFWLIRMMFLEPFIVFGRWLRAWNIFFWPEKDLTEYNAAAASLGDDVLRDYTVKAGVVDEIKSPKTLRLRDNTVIYVDIPKVTVRGSKPDLYSVDLIRPGDKVIVLFQRNADEEIGGIKGHVYRYKEMTPEGQKLYTSINSEYIKSRILSGEYDELPAHNFRLQSHIRVPATLERLPAEELRTPRRPGIFGLFFYGILPAAVVAFIIKFSPIPENIDLIISAFQTSNYTAQALTALWALILLGSVYTLARFVTLASVRIIAATGIRRRKMVEAGVLSPLANTIVQRFLPIAFGIAAIFFLRYGFNYAHQKIREIMETAELEEKLIYTIENMDLTQTYGQLQHGIGIATEETGERFLKLYSKTMPEKDLAALKDKVDAIKRPFAEGVPQDAAELRGMLKDWLENMEDLLAEQARELKIPFEKGKFTKFVLEEFTATPSDEMDMAGRIRGAFGHIMNYVENNVFKKIPLATLNVLDPEGLLEPTRTAFRAKMLELIPRSFNDHATDIIDEIIPRGSELRQLLKPEMQALHDSMKKFSALTDPENTRAIEEHMMHFADKAEDLIEKLSSHRSGILDRMTANPMIQKYLRDNGIDTGRWFTLSGDYARGDLSEQVHEVLRKVPIDEMQGQQIYLAYDVVIRGMTDQLIDYVHNHVESVRYLTKIIMEIPVENKGLHDFMKSVLESTAKSGLSVYYGIGEGMTEDAIQIIKNIASDDVEGFVIRHLLVHKGLLVPTIKLLTHDDDLAAKLNALWDSSFDLEALKAHTETGEIKNLVKAMGKYYKGMEVLVPEIPGYEPPAGTVDIVMADGTKIHMGMPGQYDKTGYIKNINILLKESLKQQNLKEWKEIAATSAGTAVGSVAVGEVDVPGVFGVFIKLMKKLFAGGDKAFKVELINRNFTAMVDKVIYPALSGMEYSPDLVPMHSHNIFLSILGDLDDPDPFIDAIIKEHALRVAKARLVTNDPGFGGKVLDDLAKDMLKKEEINSYYEFPSKYAEYRLAWKKVLVDLKKTYKLPVNTDKIMDSSADIKTFSIDQHNKYVELGERLADRALNAGVNAAANNGQLSGGAVAGVVDRTWDLIQGRTALKFELASGIAEQVSADFSDIDTIMDELIESDVESLGGAVYKAFKGVDDLEELISGNRLDDIKDHFLRTLNYLKLRAVYADPENAPRINRFFNDEAQDIEDAYAKYITSKRWSNGAEAVFFMYLGKFIKEADISFGNAVREVGGAYMGTPMFTEYQSALKIATMEEGITEAVGLGDIKDGLSRAERNLEQKIVPVMERAPLGNQRVYMSIDEMEDMFARVYVTDEFTVDAALIMESINASVEQLSKKPGIGLKMKKLFADFLNIQSGTKGEIAAGKLLKAAGEMDNVMLKLHIQKGLPYYHKMMYNMAAAELDTEHIGTGEIVGTFEKIAASARNELVDINDSPDLSGTYFAKASQRLMDAMKASSSMSAFERHASADTDLFIKNIVERISGQDVDDVNIRNIFSADVPYVVSAEDYARQIEQVLRQAGFSFKEAELISIARQGIVTGAYDLDSLKVLYLSIRARAQEIALDSFYRDITMLGREDLLITLPEGVAEDSGRVRNILTGGLVKLEDNRTVQLAGIPEHTEARQILDALRGTAGEMPRMALLPKSSDIKLFVTEGDQAYIYVKNSVGHYESINHKLFPKSVDTEMPYAFKTTEGYVDPAKFPIEGIDLKVSAEEAENLLINLRATVKKIAHILYVYSDGDEDLKARIMDEAKRYLGDPEVDDQGMIDANRLRERHIIPFFKAVTGDIVNTLGRAGGTVTESNVENIILHSLQLAHKPQMLALILQLEILPELRAMLGEPINLSDY